MHFVHIADTHLGLAAFSKIDPESGMNLREKLVYENFLAGIDAIIRTKPDAVVHAGDLFHHVKPKTRAYTTVFEMLERLREAEIPLLAIAGNHSMAKTRYTPSPFELLEYHGAWIHAAYRYRYERAEVGDTTFHLIPNMLDPESYRAAFDRIVPSTTTENVLVTHGLASALKEKRMHTVAEHEIDATILSECFAYIALGHFHGQVQVADNAWYSGSVEYCSYGEIGDTKGALLVDTARRDVRRIDLPRTPMIDLGLLRCEDLSASAIGEEITARIGSLSPGGALPICQCTLQGAQKETRKAVEGRALQEARNLTMDLRLRVIAADDDAGPPLTNDLGGVDYIDEFERFLADQHLPPKQHAALGARGRELLTLALARHQETDDAHQ
jgi:DNA repair exonuclease SbcCD nuclease subunit